MKPPVLSALYTWAQVEASATALKHGIANRLPDELIVNAGRVAQILECVQGLVGGIAVSSWFRCPDLNLAVGSKPTSMHLEALAADWLPLNVSLEVAFERIKASALPFDQLIIEGTQSGSAWIHTGLSCSKSRREVLRGNGPQLGGPMTFTRLAAG